ncbi:unnamed protein product [Auanema sp. JU1783]|nr:unnamed protein product [Auanema sp. JU1783]
MGSTVLGLGACALSSVFFGSLFVPIKKFDPGNGLFVQWVMAAAIFMVGLLVSAFRGFPMFQPFAMLGGMFWSLGNCSSIPIMSVIGMGLGMLIWGITNCIAGWATGRFGLFGINPTIPSMPVLNYFGLLLVIVGGFLFSQVRSQCRNAEDLPEEGDDESEDENTPLVQAERYDMNRRCRYIAIGAALVAGLFYGITFLPVIYIQDHPDLYPGSSSQGLDYVFSHFTGIFATSTVAFLIYVLASKNRPSVNARLIGPSFLSGIMWAIAQSSWFVANDNISQAVSFPIISMVPGVCGALWSVFYFKEISGRSNLRLLAMAVLVTLLGAVAVGYSK